MTDFDELYALTQELNRNFDRTVGRVKRGESLPHQQRHTVPIVDAYVDAEYGSLTIDGVGQLFDIQLDAYEVSQSNESQIVALILQTVNSALSSRTGGD
ncbi:hypothetical protein [Nocardia sp. NPDC058666]|uniref:hypothetical protein n=1 Tax=unclassified Nocardia TaxID=2637762 RepID=UPI00365BD051